MNFVIELTVLKADVYRKYFSVISENCMILAAAVLSQYTRVTVRCPALSNSYRW